MSRSSNAASSLRVAFVGVGRMGSALLQSVLSAGYQVDLYDPSEQATAPFVAAHPGQVRVASSAAEAARRADVIDIVVNTDEQLLAACSGQGGVFEGAHPGSIVLIHSTVLHDTLRKLGEQAQARGIQLLDAPVSGARGHLSVGDLVVMVGGDAQAFERACPVMETYGGLVLHLGPLGSGLDGKLAINLLRYLCMAAGQEATILAEQAGLGDVMGKLVTHSEANRYVGNLARLRGMAEIPDSQRRKDAEVAQKDLRAAIARGHELGVVLPSAECALGLMHRLWGTREQTSGEGTGLETREGE